ncbi:helix-hairpin-helix domain-containing protein [Candidatus Solincola sp.]|nr:helix-hairpin-helix domain-containing protein [Actinomycetota bacterium]MDI7251320.1 helix-hairpin-helix domain-containing protein [Actinomycetota bacterium]
MLEKLSSLLDWASGLSYRQLAMVVALLLAAGVGGYFLLRPAPRPEGNFLPAQEEQEAEAAETRLAVHVAGAVVHPGVVLLDPGARVMDAVEQAGGALPDADLDSLNLAQPVRDGQKITVPRKGESVGDQDGAASQAGGRVNINTAGKEELERLPGIGPTLAQRILDYREANGGFRSVEELRKVSGIGPKKFEELKDLVEI